MRGVPTATICTTAFRELALATAQGLHLPGVPVVLLPHPVGGRTQDVIDQFIGAAMDDFVVALTGSRE